MELREMIESYGFMASLSLGGRVHLELMKFET